MTVDPKYTKAVSSSLMVQTEENTLQDVFGANLVYTLCDRTVTSNEKGTYFTAFGLPSVSGACTTASTLSTMYPELQQLNVDKMIIVPIPAAYYSEMIDGRSVTLKIPQVNAAGTQTSMSSVTLYSSTYTGDKILKSETSPMLGDNVAFLFSDTINKPYTGLTLNEIGELVSNSANTTWNPNVNNFLQRPSATQYQEVKRYLDVYNAASDTRGSINFSVNVGGSSYPDNRAGYNYDIPVGFVVLDRGYAVITSPTLVNNFPWTSGYTTTGAALVGPTLATQTNIYFTGTTGGYQASELIFEDLSTHFSTTAVLLAMPMEFTISSNPTWNRDLAIAAMSSQSSVVSLPDIYITEIGLFNALGELVAISETSEPILKTPTSLFNMTIDLEF